MNKKTSVEYLQDQIDRYQREEAERFEEVYEERQRARWQREEEKKRRLHFPESWEEAFSSRIELLERERTALQLDDIDDPFFDEEIEKARAVRKAYDKHRRAADRRLKEIERRLHAHVIRQVIAEIEDDEHAIECLLDDDHQRYAAET